MEKLKILKSIHVLSGVPIQVFDKDFNLTKVFKSSSARILDYNLKSLANGVPMEDGKFGVVSGSFNELFVLYGMEDRNVLFGPFRCNVIDREMLERKLAAQGTPRSEWSFLYDYLSSLPLYALGDVRDIMIHINYCLTGDMSDPLEDELYDYVDRFYVELEEERVHAYDARKFNPNVYLFYYETEILQYVKAGRTEDLKKMVYELSNAVIPPMAGDILRSEKDYSILVFEKLAKTAIDAGADIIEVYFARNSFVRKTEESEVLRDVLKVRDAAIVHYTSEVGKSRSKGYSRLVSGIIQYIGLNANRPLRAQEIADAFHLSPSAIQKKFKAETGSTIQQYITQHKVSEAKVMLKSGLTVTEVAVALGFFDSSHFSRVFKRITGSTPRRYQDDQASGWRG